LSSSRHRGPHRDRQRPERTRWASDHFARPQKKTPGSSPGARGLGQRALTTHHGVPNGKHISGVVVRTIPSAGLMPRSALTGRAAARPLPTRAAELTLWPLSPQARQLPKPLAAW
jgi:hypothetical protein